MLHRLRKSTDERLIVACRVATAFVAGAMVIDFIQIVMECI